jgi:signal transduction histidine kinase
MGFRSAMVVPLHGAEGQLGVMLLASGESGRRYNTEDLELSEELASRAAMAIDNARLYRVVQAGVRQRDEFLSIAAHELRTPTTSLLAYAQLLQRRMQREQTGTPRDQRAVTVIAEQADRLSQLINSLLDLSRIEMGRLALARRPVELVGLLQRLVEDLRPSLQAHTLHIDSEVESLVVQGDEVRLEQVFQNLLGNAIKYSPSGGPVTVCIAYVEDQAIVSVTDTGIGIPDVALPQLFQRFYRAENVHGTDISGIGIGLYVVQEIVSRHNGSVEVTSVEGEGSTFSVRLPVGDRG